MSLVIRVAVAQVDSHMAYLSTTDLIHEPTGQDLGLGNYLQIPVLQSVREKIGGIYIDQLRIRLEAIVEYAASRHTHLLVFPEYSIPPQVLPDICRWASAHNVVVVAGSHSISTKAKEIYARLGMDINCHTTDPRSDIRKAACPVFFPDGNKVIYLKRHRSKWEDDLVESDQPWNWQTVVINGHSVNLGILVCIDALKIGSLPEPEGPGLVVVPSRSPTVEDFENFSKIQLLRELPVAYVNDAEAGRSKVYGIFGKTNQHPLMDQSGTRPIPAGSECVVIADVKLDQQFLKARSALDHHPITLVSYAPVMYMSNSEHKQVADALDITKSTGSCDRLAALLALESPPEVLRNNIRWLVQRHKSGGSRKDDFDLYLDIVKVPSPALPLRPLQYRLLREVDDAILEALPRCSIGDRQGILALLGNVEKQVSDREHTLKGFQMANSDMPTDGPRPSVDTTRVPFLDRSDELETIRAFSNNPSKRVLAVFGLRGIGKTRLVQEALVQVFPNRTVKFIQLTEGTGFPRFIYSLAGQLNVAVSLEEEEKLDEPNVYLGLISRILDAFDRLPAGCIVVDDCHYLLYKKGFRDARFAVFLDLVLARNTHKNNKVIMISKRWFSPSTLSDAFVPLKLGGLNDGAIRGVLDWHLKSQRRDADPIQIPAVLLEKLHGNPLAALVASQLLEQFPPEAVVSQAGVQQQFQERLIPQLLDQMPLPQDELRFIEFVSVFNVPVPFQALTSYRGAGNVADAITGLMDKFLLEYESATQSYEVHPLIRDYFRDNTTSEARREYHAMAAKYYEPLAKSRTGGPVVLGEYVSHLAGSGSLSRATHFGRVYGEELRPIAHRWFKDREYAKALEFYESLLRMTPDDSELQFHVALCYARLDVWDRALAHFDKAVVLNPSGWWMYTGIADAMVSKRRHLPAAEKYLLQAMEIAQSGDTPPRKLSAIFISMGKVYQLQRNWSLAEKHFRQAVRIYPNSAFAHYELAKFIVRNNGDLQEALEHVNIALQIDTTLKSSHTLRERIIDGMESREIPDTDDSSDEPQYLGDDEDDEATNT